MDDLINGTIKGWPVSLMIQRGWVGCPADGAHCCTYTDEDDNSAPDEIKEICYAITNACDGMNPCKSLRKAKSMGFVPDER